MLELELSELSQHGKGQTKYQFEVYVFFNFLEFQMMTASVISLVIFFQVFQKDELKQILGDIQVSISLTPEQWGKILEQILLVVLILGR